MEEKVTKEMKGQYIRRRAARREAMSLRDSPSAGWQLFRPVRDFGRSEADRACESQLPPSRSARATETTAARL